MGYLGKVGGGLASALGPHAGHRLIEILCRLVPVRDRVLEPPIHAWGQPAAEQPILAGQQMDRLEHGGHVAVLTRHVPARVLMAMVGSMIVLLSVRGIIQSMN